MSGNAQVGMLELGERVRLPRMKIYLERDVMTLADFWSRRQSWEEIIGEREGLVAKGGIKH